MEYPLLSRSYLVSMHSFLQVEGHIEVSSIKANVHECFWSHAALAHRNNCTPQLDAC